jgi:hypothetical protein
MTGRSRTLIFAARTVAAAVLLLNLSASAMAQEPRGLLAPGDAAVTGFSGAPPPVQLAPGIDPAANTFIDLDGPSLEVFDLQDLHGPARAQLVRTPKPFSAKASQIGQVFGVMLDSATPPNIYVAASSVYGLPIVAAGADGELVHVRKGHAGARFMPGLWGAAAPEGGPGSIWKIDGASGTVSLFANVGYEGRKNSGPALGGLAFDPQSQSLYAADRETGLIHRFGPDGAERGRYDHGVTGREAMAMKPVPFDPSRALDVAKPPFDSADSATWNYAPPERLVFGLAVAARRLYYSVAADQQIWSVGLAPDGAFMADPRPEIVVPPAAGPTEISKIAFDEQGRMFLAERPSPTGAFDFAQLSLEGIGRVLRYERFLPPGGPPQWRPLPEEYSIGFPRQLRNANGGVAISYLYDSRGRIDRRSCGGFLWTTGEDLRASADPALAAQLRNWGPEHVQGLQGVESWRIRRDDEPPLHACFTDYDDHFDDFSARGHLGDLAIFRACGLAESWGADVWGESGVGAPPLFGFPPGGPKGPPKPPPPHKCTLLGACPPPPCRPDERRGRDGQCQPIPCPAPSALVGGNCCKPGILATAACYYCSGGQVSVGPSHSCCPSSKVYSDTNGVSACCPGQVVNGQCQPGTPNNPGAPQCQPGQTPPCCGAGYVQTGAICCLSGQASAHGTCCPVGETPVGDACQPIHFTPPGPACCAAGQTQTMNGQCCATANITTQGICCPSAVNPQEPGHCPAQIQSIVACRPGYTRMPDKSCCLTSHVSSDGKSCVKIALPTPVLPPRVSRRPPIDCSARGPRFIRDPRQPSACVHCGRGMIANDDATACVRIARPPERQPPPRAPDCSAQGPRFINNPNNPAICIRCPPGMIANGDADACVRFGPPPVYGPPGVYGPPPVWIRPRPHFPGFPGRPPPRFPPGGFRPGPLQPGGPAVAPRTF